jgi:hypothetical protein
VPTVKVSATFQNAGNRKESCEKWTAVPRRRKRWITSGVNDVAVQIGDGSERWKKGVSPDVFRGGARSKGSAGFYTWPSVPYFKAVFSNQANLIPA